MDQERLRRAAAYADGMRVAGTWRFRSARTGGDTVYASCFAAMIWRYADCLAVRTSERDRMEWADYLNSFQDPETGSYLVPEIVSSPLSSDAHDREHLLMHACAHILPALDALGARPRYALSFAHRFLDEGVLDEWLSRRDWTRAWIEGNNLLFVGQFLLHVARQEGRREAEGAVRRLMEWLDREVDPNTGLWGTQGFCTLHDALYGGYHQLLLYFYLRHPFPHLEALVRSVLSLQHFDGGFHAYRGGGTCQDVDAIDVLVNAYKRRPSQRRQIRRALRRAQGEVAGRQVESGGFVDRHHQGFSHMGMTATFAPAGEANMFSTWFGVHTLLLIDEVLGPRGAESRTTRFNRCCSMGWHDVELDARGEGSRIEAAVDGLDATGRRIVVAAYDRAALMRARRSARRAPAPVPGAPAGGGSTTARTSTS